MNRFFLFISLCFCLSTATAQSLIQQLGGTPTQFTIVLDDQPLEVAEQYIIKRAVSRYKSGSKLDGGYGYGYGYESYHLEFSLEAVRLDKESRRKRSTSASYRLAFLDENGKVLGFSTRTVKALLRFSNSDTERLNCYNIDLKGIPLTILGNCKTIKLTIRD
ncbi:MAG: hypothetical protein AAFZ63_06075 [Bacteroidota bacterium]